MKIKTFFKSWKLDSKKPDLNLEHCLNHIFPTIQSLYRKMRVRENPNILAYFTQCFLTSFLVNISKCKCKRKCKCKKKKRNAKMFADKCRSSHPEIFYKKGMIKKFAKLIGQLWMECLFCSAFLWILQNLGTSISNSSG